MDIEQLLPLILVVCVVIYLLIKVAGYKFFSKLLVMSTFAIGIFFYHQLTLPKKSLAGYGVLCQGYTGSRYYAIHLQSKRRVFIFFKTPQSSLGKDACILADNGQTLTLNWYSMTSRNQVDLNAPDSLEKIYKAKNRVAVNGSYGNYYIFSPTTLPLFSIAISAYKDDQGWITLKRGYNDDRTIFIDTF